MSDSVLFCYDKNLYSPAMYTVCIQKERERERGEGGREREAHFINKMFILFLKLMHVTQKILKQFII